MRALEYFVATSIDGYIAREDGDFTPLLVEGDSLATLVEEYPDTLPAQARAALGIDAANLRFDTVLMGAATYRVPSGLPSPYPHLRQYVVSRSIRSTPDDVTLVSGDLLPWVRGLKAEEGRAIWLCGGGTLAGQLLPEIDRLFIKISPIVLGRGRPLFATEVPGVRFTRTAVRPFGNGVVFVEYERTRQDGETPGPA